MNQNYEKLKQYVDKAAALGAALSLFGWDNETLAPKNSMEKTSKLVGILSSEYFNTIINNEVEQLLKELKVDNTLEEVEKAVVRCFAEDIDSLKTIPPQDFVAYSELTSKASSIWANARVENNFKLFEPVLAEIIEYNKKFAGTQAKDGQKIYDVKLDEYEKSFHITDLDEFFNQLKDTIVPLLKKIKEKESKKKQENWHI